MTAEEQIDELKDIVSTYKGRINALEANLKNIKLAIISECEANYTAFTGYGKDKYLYAFQLLHGIIEDNGLEPEYNDYLDEIYGKEKKKWHQKNKLKVYKMKLIV